MSGEPASAAALKAAADGILAALRGAERDIERQMYAQAARESAVYATTHMLTARPLRSVKHRDGGRLDLLEEALSWVRLDGFYAEFGVYRGETLTFIADRIDKVVYGFDSFEGLPEPWFLNYSKGFLSLNGQAPAVAPEQRNARLVAGPFADTLPVFTGQIDGPAAFLHLDCDLYASTRTALEGLADRIIPGTVIVFGAYLNYPGWQAHAWRAFSEFRQAHGLNWRYLAFTPAMFSAAGIVEA